MNDSRDGAEGSQAPESADDSQSSASSHLQPLEDAVEAGDYVRARELLDGLGTELSDDDRARAGQIRDLITFDRTIAVATVCWAIFFSILTTIILIH